MRLKLAVVFACLILLCGPSLAQVATSRLEGVVQDQSGAIIPGASVSAVNNKTQIRADTTTNQQGNFIFPSLRPGEYTLSVEAQGFRKAVRSAVVLNVGDTVAEIIKMDVGSVAESVVVEANAVRVQTSDAQMGRNVTLRDIEVLPSLNRAPLALAIFANPGISIDPSDSTFSRVNGTRQGSNNSTLDGIDVNDHMVPRMGLSLTAVNTDSVEELQLVSGGKAEFGRSAGAQQQMISRSGTNDYHGSAFEYLRNTALNANNFFNNQAQPSIERPKIIQNTFGGTFGGHMIKDRTFFFGNYQGRRTAQTTSRLRNVLTPEAKAGLFRWPVPGSGVIQSFDIFKNDPRRKGLDPQVATLLKMLPDPNDFSAGDKLNTAGFRFNNPSGSYEDQFTIKGDHNLWSANHVFLRWSWQRNSSIDALNSADAPFPGQVQGRQGGHRWGYSIGDDWTLTSRMVNEFRFGYQSSGVDFLRPGRVKGPMLLPNLYTSPIYTAFAQGRNSPVREFTDNLSIVHGKHTIKGGFSWRFTTAWGYNDAGIYPNVDLTINFNNSVPIGPSGSAVIDSTFRQRFDNLYNDLLGRMSRVQQTYYSDLEKFQPAGSSRVRDYKFREYGYFFQDDWKVRPNLTLNLGLRYEFSGVPFETNKFQGTLDKAALINSVSQIADLTVQRSTNWYNNDWNNFAPRLGFAWDISGQGKTAIRGNWGVFYDRLIGSTTSYVDSNTPGFSQLVPVYPNNATGSDVRAGDGIPATPQPAAPVLTLAPTRSTNIGVFAPDLRTGYVMQYSLGIQQELFRNTVIDASYVGNRGIKLFMDVNYNQSRIYGGFLQDFRELQAYRGNPNSPISPGNTLVKLFGSAGTAISTLGGSNFDQGAVGSVANTVDVSNYPRYAAAGVSPFYLRNYPQYQQVVVGTNDGRSYYDSLQLNLRRQVGVLKFNANYTFSKSIDNISVDGNGFTNPIDNFNLRLNRSRGDADRPHTLSSSFIYTLPIGKGRRFAGSAPRWADSLIGGWDVGLLTIWQSGSVVTYSAGRNTGPNNVNSWADYTGDRKIGSVMRRGDSVAWLTDDQITALTYPVAGSIGSGGRNAFRGPRFFNMDASLMKAFKITENSAVKFRAEAINLLNNVNFSNPRATLTDSALGKLTTTINNARVIQMALRYDF